MANVPNPRVAAGLWFTASALSLAAAVIHYAGNGEIKWFLLAASLFTAAVGYSTLRRSKSTGA
ncbi:MAG TPA: hypothetical protein VFF17_10255 [Thermoanaerobaculia bacterium]|nr:hypothetical protein [Thermoanaerobaculia bacterium]